MSDAPDARAGLLRGVLDLLVLRVLVAGPRHGRGIERHLQQVFEGVPEVRIGSMYGRLRRLERYGWVTSEYRLSESARLSRFYRLTPHGWKQLEAGALDWSSVQSLVSATLLGG